MGRLATALTLIVGLAASALVATPAALAQSPSDIVFNEIHFHPQCNVNYKPCPDPLAEFIELHNSGPEAIDIGGWQLSDGVEYTIPLGTELAAGGFYVLAEDALAFFHEFGIAAQATFRGGLSNGGERLELSSLDGTIIDEVRYDDGSDTPGSWEVSADGEGDSLQLISAANDDGTSVWWAAADPTPGAQNATVGQSPGAAVDSFTWTEHPDPGQPIVVDATVYGTANVTLEYRINYPGTIQNIVMTNLGDNRFTATIPGAAAGELVRFRLQAGGTVVAPTADDSINWVGTTVFDPAVNTNLPLLEWFTSTTAYNQGFAEQGDRTYDGVLAYNGKVYDNVGFRIRGIVARTADWRKRNWKFKLPDHHAIKIDGISYALDSLDLQGGFADESRIREYMGHTIAAEMGLVASEVQHVRLHLNGNYYGLHTLQEHPEGGFLDRNGLDNATLYKGVEGAYSAGPTGIAGQTSINWENWDIPGYINMLAAASVIQNNDFAHSNAFWWYDADQHQRYEGMIWDLDLSQGIRYRPDAGLTTWLQAGNYATVWWRWRNQAPIFSQVLGNPWRPLYLRRLRTLADEWFGTGLYAQRVRQQFAMIGNEWNLDTNRWGFWGNQRYTAQQAIDRYANTWINNFYTHIANGGPNGDIPGPQKANPNLSLAVDPAPTDIRNEHIRIINHENTAIDISGWTISGSTTATLPPGAVLPAGGSAYVVGDDTRKGFRAATNNLYVLGEYDAALNNGGGQVNLVKPDGQVRASTSWGAGAPSPGLVLNEWNAVSSSQLLDDGDTRLGSVAGNGGDWFELVVVDDHLDIRRWKLELHDSGTIDTILNFTNDPLWADLRAGTIITVGERPSVAEDGTIYDEDPSYRPGRDWWIHVIGGELGSGDYISARDFRVSNDDWQLAVYDDDGVRRFGPAGEGIGSLAAGGVANDEIGELEAHPSPTLDAAAPYGDGNGSSFGEPNVFALMQQDFAALRPDVAAPGDVDCDTASGLIDALYISQYTVGDRTDSGGCPIDGSSRALDLGGADLDGNALVDEHDVMMVLECIVGPEGGAC